MEGNQVIPGYRLQEEMNYDSLPLIPSKLMGIVESLRCEIGKWGEEDLFTLGHKSDTFHQQRSSFPNQALAMAVGAVQIDNVFLQNSRNPTSSPFAMDDD